MLGTSCVGSGDDGGRVVGRGRRPREGFKEIAADGVVRDCGKSIRGIPHHSIHKPQTVLWHTIVCYKLCSDILTVMITGKVLRESAFSKKCVTCTDMPWFIIWNAGHISRLTDLCVSLISITYSLLTGVHVYVAVPCRNWYITWSFICLWLALSVNILLACNKYKIYDCIQINVDN